VGEAARRRESFAENIDRAVELHGFCEYNKPMGAIPEQVVFDWVVDRAKRWLNPKSIILYGSRARRDHNDRSDYDFAFEIDELSRPNGLAKLHWEAGGDDGPTLLAMDLLDLRDPITPELRENIGRDGLVLYERT
jgi:uncharacterized protein